VSDNATSNSVAGFLISCCLWRRCYFFPAASGAGDKAEAMGGQSDFDSPLFEGSRNGKRLQCIVIPYDRYLIAIHHLLCNVIVTIVAIAITNTQYCIKPFVAQALTLFLILLSQSAMVEELRIGEDVFEAKETESKDSEGAKETESTQAAPAAASTAPLPAPCHHHQQHQQHPQHHFLRHHHQQHQQQQATTLWTKAFG
jgi:hypothetical protein